MNPRDAIGARFDFKDDGVDYLKLCLDVCLYFQGSLREHAAGVKRFYQTAMDLVGDRFTFYQSEWMKRPKKMSPEVKNLLPEWLDDLEDHGLYMLFLESGTTKSAVSDAAFTLHAMSARNLGALRLVLPADFIAQGAARLIDVAKQAASDLRFVSGHGGFALHFNDRGDLTVPAQHAVWPVVARYHGVDCTNIGSLLYAMEESLPKGQGLKCVNWLTFVGEPLLGALGGAKAVTARMGEGPVVHPLPGGILIQAGPEPEIGDSNRRQRLPLYQQVGKVLAPVRIQDHPAFIWSNEKRTFDKELTRQFLERFDE